MCPPLFGGLKGAQAPSSLEKKIAPVECREMAQNDDQMTRKQHGKAEKRNPLHHTLTPA